MFQVSATLGGAMAVLVAPSHPQRMAPRRGTLTESWRLRGSEHTFTPA